MSVLMKDDEIVAPPIDRQGCARVNKHGSCRSDSRRTSKHHGWNRSSRGVWTAGGSLPYGTVHFAFCILHGLSPLKAGWVGSRLTSDHTYRSAHDPLAGHHPPHLDPLPRGRGRGDRRVMCGLRLHGATDSTPHHWCRARRQSMVIWLAARTEPDSAVVACDSRSGVAGD